MLLTCQWLAACLLWPSAGHNRNGIGALRLRGRRGIVVRRVAGAIDVGPGLVRVEREEWPAESSDDTPIAAGTWVLIIDVRGNRLVVGPLDGYSANNGAQR